MFIILSIDPGLDKCGIAVVSHEQVYTKEIIQVSALIDSVSDIMGIYDISKVIVGNGTGSNNIINQLKKRLSIPIITVDESNTTLRARELYIKENPPRGIYRFIPKGLIAPKKPYDDYTAVIIAKDYLNEKI